MRRGRAGRCPFSRTSSDRVIDGRDGRVVVLVRAHAGRAYPASHGCGSTPPDTGSADFRDSRRRDRSGHEAIVPCSIACCIAAGRSPSVRRTSRVTAALVGDAGADGPSSRTPESRPRQQRPAHTGGRALCREMHQPRPRVRPRQAVASFRRSTGRNRCGGSVARRRRPRLHSQPGAGPLRAAIG